jgi:hypothetical protein
MPPATVYPTFVGEVHRRERCHVVGFPIGVALDEGHRIERRAVHLGAVGIGRVRRRHVLALVDWRAAGPVRLEGRPFGGTARPSGVAQEPDERRVGEVARQGEAISGSLLDVHPCVLHLSHGGERRERLRHAADGAHRRDGPVLRARGQPGPAVALEVDDLVLDRHAHSAARGRGAVELARHDLVRQRPRERLELSVLGGSERGVDFRDVVAAGLHRRLGATNKKARHECR